VQRKNFETTSYPIQMVDWWLRLVIYGGLLVDKEHLSLPIAGQYFPEIFPQKISIHSWALD